MELNDIETELDLEPFFSQSQDYLCIAGYDGYFRKINPAFIKLMGYTREELFANPISHFVHPKDRQNTAETRAKILEGIPLLHFQNRYLTKSGEIVWLTWTSIPIPDKELIYAISKNITHLKKLEEDRHIRIRDLTSKNSGLTQLSYATAQDLRSPVNNLISLVKLLDRSKIQDDETLLYLELLEKSVHKLKRTLNDQVDHLQGNRFLEPNFEPVNLNEVIQNILDSLHSLIEETETSFEIDFSSVEVLKVNEFYLHSIFLNLITNSIKYAQPGLPPLISISSKKNEAGSQIHFIDNGTGFDMEKSENRLFELHQKFTDHKDSKGIGLYLVKSYMNSLGGDIDVESKIGVGTSFILSFKD
ncbi:sensor histidine kinase [Salegentibacter salarius]|uniref:histidine kinase n=1 Tax=Salegentibacter salarius TaxID=435906 RepID=A0A2N0U4W1_9FLAO|nr:PAS domain-containing sensor histidine kinase [Salegentibacter salarius]OEY71357.1 PAS domain-containing sensor histidine kinase [Salegentibacter salarius]PKD22039.1 histidine kinase [Salegentibacter salarius]SLJ92684.1 PAS domain S-box-containing protein [Salegentibacter salarius]